MPQKKRIGQVHPPSPEEQKPLGRHTDFQTLAKEAESREDWKAAANLIALAVKQRSAELALIVKREVSLPTIFG
jgi:hypothetical protein